MGGWLKFTGDNWDAYIMWPNVADAIRNCTPLADSASRYALTVHSDNVCWDKLNCALAAADPSQQAQYSSTATILGLLPTVLSVMATSSSDLLLIHHRYPLLALLLSLCNPSTILSDLTLLNGARQANYERLLKPSTHSDDYHVMLSRVHSTVRSAFSFKTGANPVPETRKHKLLSFIHETFLHILVACIASIVVWQSVLLGMRGVFVYACWTWHEPFTWLGVGALTHVLSFTFFRLCLSRVNTSDPWYTKFSWSLSRSGGLLKLAHPRIAKFFDLVFQVVGLMNYGFGTVMLSGINLVSPQSGLKVFCLMGFAAVASRLVAIWLLEVWPEVPIQGLVGMRTGNSVFDERRLDMVGKEASSGVNESSMELLAR